MPDLRDKPLFLARQGYRQRRVIDAARMLPVLGAFLLLVPVLWDLGGAGGTDAPPRLAERGAYIFGIWMLLVLGAAMLGGRLRDVANPPTDDGGTATGAVRDAPARAARPGAADDGAA